MGGIATIDIAGVAVPRLAFGLGSLMKWAPGHTHPLPTDSSVEVRQAIAAGFRHFNSGDLYTNNDSAATVLKTSGLKREEIFFSLKLNTYAMLGCKGRQSMIDSVSNEINRFGLDGYVDLLQLHFPPRGHPGNLSNREAWQVLEDMKDSGVARLIGLSNWTVKDYQDIVESPGVKHMPQVNEYEFNPYLLWMPEFLELRSYGKSQNIVSASGSINCSFSPTPVVLTRSPDYGILTIISGKLPHDESAELTRALQKGSSHTGLSAAELLLYWAYHRLDGIVVTSTSKAERATSLVKLLSKDGSTLPVDILDGIEQAAKADGFESKVFYAHAHMDKAGRM